MADVSGFGILLNLVASVTFPAGFGISQFDSEADPLDIPSLQIRDSSMGPNGDLISWSKANPIKPTISVIPDSDDDINLSILLEANRVSKGKVSAGDILTLSIIYPNNKTTTLSNGYITDGMVANAVASSGRIKVKTYIFAFQDVTSTRN
jgi:hypothetical protein